MLGRDRASNQEARIAVNIALLGAWFVPIPMRWAGDTACTGRQWDHLEVASVAGTVSCEGCTKYPTANATC
jgi:hypothetical protein